MRWDLVADETTRLQASKAKTPTTTRQALDMICRDCFLQDLQVQLLKKMAARSVAGARMFTIYLARDLGVPQSRIEQVVTDWGKRDWVEFSGEWQELVVADSLWVRA